jgi:hypothetical protein
MKKRMRTAAAMMALLLSTALTAQEKKVNTLFGGSRVASSGGYGAITNKFTKICGEYANLPGIYGGWYINHKLMIGVGAAASTNTIRVPAQYNTRPGNNQTYQYGQFGLTTEYVLNSHKPIHLVLQAFGGAGFTLQYERNKWYNNNGHDPDISDENWFVVAEPGVQLEMNLFRWMRFSPGISYRATFGSDGAGVKDKDLSAVSYNATLKFGRF